jgi:hypothetical protein
MVRPTKIYWLRLARQCASGKPHGARSPRGLRTRIGPWLHVKVRPQFRER